MKTYKEWDLSELNLDKYLTEPCEIDEELELYIGEIVAPQYLGNGLTQMGEAEKDEDGIPFYMTTSCVNGKYFYLGVLPEFKQ